MPRDPYPFPRLQNDGDFCRQQGRRENGKKVDFLNEYRGVLSKDFMDVIKTDVYIGSYDTNELALGQLILSQVKETGTLTQTSSEGTPWDRLNKTATLASSRREIFHHDPQAPNDSLDFVIKSTYDHHKEFLSSQAETLVQPETDGLQHGRILKNRPPPEEPEIDLYKLPLTKSTSVQRQSIHSINGAIESHHSAATNGGYSRKHDGGFYTC